MPSLLAVAVQAAARRILDQDHPPLRRKIEPRQHRRRIRAGRGPPSTRTPPWSKPAMPMPERAPRSSRFGERRGAQLEAMEFRESTAQGQRQLGAGAEPDVWRQAPALIRTCSGSLPAGRRLQLPDAAGAPAAVRGSLRRDGIDPLARQRASISHRRRHALDHHAEAAEPAPQRAARIEKAEVQTRRRGNGHRSRHRAARPSAANDASRSLGSSKAVIASYSGPDRALLHRKSVHCLAVGAPALDRSRPLSVPAPGLARPAGRARTALQVQHVAGQDQAGARPRSAGRCFSV